MLNSDRRRPTAGLLAIALSLSGLAHGNPGAVWFEVDFDSRTCSVSQQPPDIIARDNGCIFEEEASMRLFGIVSLGCPPEGSPATDPRDIALEDRLGRVFLPSEPLCLDYLELLQSAENGTLGQ